MIKYPPGAIKSFMELKQCKSDMFYLTCVSEKRYMKFDSCRFKPFMRKHRGYNFYFYRDGICVANLWTPSGQFTFNGDYVFANYWYLHVYLQTCSPDFR